MSEYLVMELFKIYVEFNPNDFKPLSREDLWKAFSEFARRVVNEAETDEPPWLRVLG